MSVTTELSEETDLILTNAVHHFLRRCPHARFVQDFDELKHEAWMLLPKVSEEYDQKRCGGNYARFAIQRLSWRLFDLARSKTWAPQGVKKDDRKQQLSGTPEFDDHEKCSTIHPAHDMIEADALRGLADKFKRVLPLHYREVFEFYYVGGLTMKEVGDRLKLTESRISQKLAIIRRLIHERFPERTSVTTNRASTG
jgi:RNA polymerase sigma factor (sigma-70 family)